MLILENHIGDGLKDRVTFSLNDLVLVIDDDGEDDEEKEKFVIFNDVVCPQLISQFQR